MNNTASRVRFGWRAFILICITAFATAQVRGSTPVHLPGSSLSGAPRSGIGAGPKGSPEVNAGKAGDGLRDALTPPTPLKLPFVDLPQEPLHGRALLTAMLLIALATLVSEDLTCIGAGLLAARGTIGLPAAVAASFAGILGGDVLLYLAGRFIGQPALRLPPLKWLLKAEDVARTSRWFAANGPAIIISSRFVPGSRLPTYFSAGMLGTGFWRFTAYFVIAAALWTPLLVGISAAAGVRMFTYYNLFRQYSLLILAATVLLLWLTVKLAVPLFSFRGRRLLLSRWRRRTRWEFWPLYVFYIPVAAYIALLGLRHRCLTLFTAANPGIPDGGFIGESKSKILAGLRNDGSFVAPYTVISSALPLEVKTEKAERFINGSGNGYPVVLKPDVGERGTGVVIVRDKNRLADALARTAADMIVQQYVAGFEYGVFYYRHPHQAGGRILSITDKRLPTVTGDGRSTLEDLILRDDRAVCMAPLHFRNHRDDLFSIPRRGQKVLLVEVGTHCRGALFLDGRAIWTPALEAAFDRISRKFEGFYFGRYDIRTPSLEDFRQGLNFKIIELNGVTSEATHIYQPGNSLRQAYRDLMQQWRIAFEIGAANRRRGAQPTAARNLLAALLARRGRR